MKYLLDVSALIAFGLGRHQFHARVFQWAHSERRASFFTCAITELGFVRIISPSSTYALSLAEAKDLLLRMKRNPVLPLDFLPDTEDISSLPSGVRTPGQATDGHLARLAIAHNAALATFDEKIPGAYLIP